MTGKMMLEELEKTVKSIENGDLTEKEQMLFVTGVWAGLHSSDQKVQKLLIDASHMYNRGDTKIKNEDTM